MIRGLRDWLIDPSVKNHDPDSLEFSIAHRQVVQSKLILRGLFEAFYRDCRAMDVRYFGNCPGSRLEIGSGAGIIDDVLALLGRTGGIQAHTNTARSDRADVHNRPLGHVAHQDCDRAAFLKS